MFSFIIKFYIDLICVYYVFFWVFDWNHFLLFIVQVFGCLDFVFALFVFGFVALVEDSLDWYLGGFWYVLFLIFWFFKIGCLWLRFDIVLLCSRLIKYPYVHKVSLHQLLFIHQHLFDIPLHIFPFGQLLIFSTLFQFFLFFIHTSLFFLWP